MVVVLLDRDKNTGAGRGALGIRYSVTAKGINVACLMIYGLFCAGVYYDGP